MFLLKVLAILVVAVAIFYSERLKEKNLSKIYEVARTLDREGRKLLGLKQHPIVNSLFSRRIGILLLRGAVLGSSLFFVFML